MICLANLCQPHLLNTLSISFLILDSVILVLHTVDSASKQIYLLVMHMIQNAVTKIYVLHVY